MQIEEYISEAYPSCDACATARFIEAHAGCDVHSLAIKGFPAGVHREFALMQLSGRRSLAAKLPLWHSTPGIVCAPRVSMEQCSSQATASYKARLVSGDTLVDLTGGLGVDFSFLSRRFASSTYVERDAGLCAIARHNFGALGLRGWQVENADGVEHLRRMEACDVIYLDPSRRDSGGRKVFRLADCQPDVRGIARQLLEKARLAMVKLSPMFDVKGCVRELPGVSEVHIVSSMGECKEMLLLLRREACAADVKVVCSDCGKSEFSFLLGDSGELPLWDGRDGSGQLCVYEPNAAVMKSLGFVALCRAFGVRAVAPDSHLFVSDKPIAGFPGREFRLIAMCSMNRKELRQHLAEVTCANVSVRNFPLTAAALAKRLKVRDGGHTYIFGTTLASGKHVLMICEKA